MAYSIGLYFDAETERRIRAVWQDMAEIVGAAYLHNSGNRPHFTLAIYTELNVSRAETEIQAFAVQTPSFSVTFPFIGFFPNAQPDLFLGPVVTSDQLSLQAAVHQRLLGCGTYPDFDYYLPGHWVPHCALAMEMDPRQTTPALELVTSRLKLPLNSRVEAIGLIEFRPVKHLLTCRLGKPECGTVGHLE
jgi:hypothetical protein